ncbi:MAG: hypothetical protein U0Z26_07510 [Anaerolineales bacterium]
MTNAKIGKVAHNAKYDYIVLAKIWTLLFPHSFDTMLAEFIVDPLAQSRLEESFLNFRLGEEMTPLT